MRELLERWSRLDKKRCQRVKDKGRSLAYTVGSHGFYVNAATRSPTTKAHNQAVIFAATIEAITARGWLWGLGNNIQGPYRSQINTPKRSVVERADTPAEALLAAYLAALEAEANS